MYSAARTVALPPQQLRLPRRVPLSRLRGATPTKAAICWRVRAPVSGSSAKRVRERTGPTPGTLCSRLSVSRQDMALVQGPPQVLIQRPQLLLQPLDVGLETRAQARERALEPVALGSEHDDELPPPCQQGAQGLGFWASRVSVLASLPVARAKSRTWRGLTTTTGRLVAAKAATKLNSRPPVASAPLGPGSIPGGGQPPLPSPPHRERCARRLRCGSRRRPRTGRPC